MANEINRFVNQSSGRWRLVWASGIALGFAVTTLASGKAIATGEPIEIKVAYLDPGTGSMVLQAIVATIAGVAVAVTTYWQKIRSLFQRGSRKSEASKTASSDD